MTSPARVARPRFIGSNADATLYIRDALTERGWGLVNAHRESSRIMSFWHMRPAPSHDECHTLIALHARTPKEARNG